MFSSTQFQFLFINPQHLRITELENTIDRLFLPLHCCSVAQSFLTLCDPMDSSMPGLPVPNHLPEFAQVHVHCISDAIQPSHPLTPSSPSALSLSQHQGLSLPMYLGSKNIEFFGVLWQIGLFFKNIHFYFPCKEHTFLLRYWPRLCFARLDIK